MPNVVGNLFPVSVEGITLNADRSVREIEIQTDSAVTLFEGVAVQASEITANAVGLYSHVRVGRNQKAKFISIKTPRHLFTSRGNGCAWTPKGMTSTKKNEYPTCAIEYNGEECPDAFYGSCFEQIFATGNQSRDFYASAEGQAVIAQLLRQTYLGLGNSFDELYNFANHPLIQLADENGFFKAGLQEWSDYTDQQLSGECGGLITQLDQLAAEGMAGFDLDIPDADIDDDGAYKGDIIALLQKLVSKAKSEFSTMIRSGLTNGATRMFPIVLMTSYEYDAYENYLLQTFSTIPAMYQYFLQKEDGTSMLMPDVLKYKGMPVVRWEACTRFDEIVGSESHRVAIVAPGAFGVAHDIEDLMQFDGMGLRILQRLDAPFKGKIYMDTTMRWGAGIADTDFVVMASNIKHP